MLSGLPVRDHVGTASLEEGGAGTKVTYALRTTPTIPYAGGVVMLVLKRAISQLLDGVSAEAERRAASGG